MDAVIASLTQAAPLGLGTVLLILVGLVVKWQGQDRADHRAQLAQLGELHANELKALTERHANELARITKAHDDELAELRAEIQGLRLQVDGLNTKLDAERDRRRDAEDAMGRHRMGESPWRA